MVTTRSIVRRFYAYRLSVSNGFYLPLSVLYLQRVRGFGLDDVGLILGAFSIAMVVAEIPTGYVGDRLGRRSALAIGNVLNVGFMLGYVVVETPLEYLLLHVIWAFGWAFRSGTADAWFYELLAVTDDESEFTRFRSNAMSIELGFEAASAATAGVLAAVLGWYVPFLVNGAIAAFGIPVLVTAPAVADVQENPEAADDPLSVHDAVRVLRLQAGRPEVRWLVVYVALFFGLYSAIRTFEQPALDAVGVPVTGLGALYAGFKLVSAGAASTTEWLADRLGPAGVFGLLGPAYGLVFLGVFALPAAVVPALFFNRSVRVIIQPIRDQYLNDRLQNVGRATVLSGASMVISVSAGLAKFVAGEASAALGILRFLTLVGIAIPILGGALWFVVSPVRPLGTPETTDTTAAD